MRKTLPPLCLLLALAVPGPLQAADAPRPERTPEARVAHLLRGMAHRSDAIVAEAKRRYATASDAHKRAPLEAALAHPLPPRVRAFCARELGRLADRRSVRVLLKASIRDGDAGVRSASVNALRKLHASRSVLPQLARVLRSRRTRDRIHAAQALGTLGDIAAAPYVLCRWTARSGDFPRGYFAQTNQLSYVVDFDVEVA